MNCKRFSKTVYLYLKNELSNELMKESEMHLKECATCRLKYEKMISLMKKSGDIIKTTSDSGHVKIYKTMPVYEAQKKISKSRFIIKTAPLAAALLFTIIVLSIIDKDGKIDQVKDNDHRFVKTTENEPPLNKHVSVSEEKKCLPDQKISSAQKPNKPSSIDDKFGECYSRWLDARRNAPEPTTVEVMYWDPDISIMYKIKSE